MKITSENKINFKGQRIASKDCKSKDSQGDLSFLRSYEVVLKATSQSWKALQWASEQLSGKKKTNKHKHFGRDGVRDKQEPSLGQTGPLPGTYWDLSLGQAGLFLFNSTVESPFCPVCPWDGWGFVPGTIVPQGPSEKCLCVFCLLVFFGPQTHARCRPLVLCIKPPFHKMHTMLEK